MSRPWRPTGWRLLGAFWGTLTSCAIVAVLVLSTLGPPRAGDRPARAAARAATDAPRVARASTPTTTGTAPPDAIAPPDPALAEADPDDNTRRLPVISADGRRPAAVYAGRLPAVLPGQARLAVVLDGTGLDHAQSRLAIDVLPAPVGFAFSPYASAPDPLANEARRRGHELLVSLPMEPQASDVDDEGDRALTVDHDDATNRRDLDWALGALAGYVGVTGADPSGNGEHFAGVTTSFRLVTDTLAARGLLYLDPGSAGAPSPTVPTARADLVLGPSPPLDRIGPALEQVAAAAARNGTAIVIAGPPRPALVDAVARFLRTLPARGIVLVPVSALTRTGEAADPADADPTIADR